MISSNSISATSERDPITIANSIIVIVKLIIFMYYPFLIITSKHRMKNATSFNSISFRHYLLFLSTIIKDKMAFN